MSNTKIEFQSKRNIMDNVKEIADDDILVYLDISTFIFHRLDDIKKTLDWQSSDYKKKRTFVISSVVYDELYRIIIEGEVFDTAEMLEFLDTLSDNKRVFYLNELSTTEDVFKQKINDCIPPITTIRYLHALKQQFTKNDIALLLHSDIDLLWLCSAYLPNVGIHQGIEKLKIWFEFNKLDSNYQQQLITAIENRYPIIAENLIANKDKINFLYKNPANRAIINQVIKNIEQDLDALESTMSGNSEVFSELNNGNLARKHRVFSNILRDQIKNITDFIPKCAKYIDIKKGNSIDETQRKNLIELEKDIKNFKNYFYKINLENLFNSRSDLETEAIEEVFEADLGEENPLTLIISNILVTELVNRINITDILTNLKIFDQIMDIIHSQIEFGSFVQKLKQEGALDKFKDPMQKIIKQGIKRDRDSSLDSEQNKKSSNDRGI